MRKLYGFLLAMLVLGAFSTEVAQAQTYAMSDYVVRKVDVPDAQGLGSGSNWNALAGGTAITSGYVGSYQGYLGYYTSNGMQMPFNVRFLNQQITTANTFSVSTNGDVIMSPTWGASFNYYAYCGYYYGYGYFYGLNNASNYTYEYDYGGYSTEQDYGSYGYYANYVLEPFSGYMYNYISYFSANIPYFKYAVLGSAPNREFVVEAGNQHPYEESFYDASGPNYGSWQTVIYENAISAFQFNYGPTVGNPRNGPDSHGYSSSPTSIGGWVWPGSWDYASVYNYGSYLYVYSYQAVTGMKAAGGQVIRICWNGNGWDATRPFLSTTNCYYGSYKSGSSAGMYWNDTARYLPKSSIKMLIAYNYDMTAGNISNPLDQSIKNLNSTQTPTFTLINAGRVQPTSVQVLFQISAAGGTAPVYSQTLTLTGAQVPAAFSSTVLTFPSFVVPAYGIYYDTVIVYNLQPTADQNPADNTTTNQWTCSPPNNIKAVQVLGPAPGTRSPVAVATPISIRFQNIGANDQGVAYGTGPIPLTCVVKDPGGNVVFRDTVYAPNIPSPNTSVARATLDTSFDGWTPTTNGTYTICGIAIMASDALRADDTTCSPVKVAFEADVAANSIVNPQPDQEEPYTLLWKPQALFQSVGVSDLFDVPARVQIRKCSDGTLVFQADSIIPELNVDNNLVRFAFPSHAGPYDITRLTPGCYNICAIARYPTDGDRSNDTVCSSFSIIDRLKGNIYVGVGQRFQSIHAAVDSMEFRGIGGNLNLILTDANYTENGTSRTASPNGAVDFRNIRGLSDTSWVTWMPKPGVTPTITFTGNKPYCFYFGDLQGGHIKFEGYNPLGVPIPDQLVAEPNKRGITIIDNSSVCGGVFGIEEGASTLSFRNLRLISNGGLANSSPAGGSMFANDSSAVIRLYNEHNFQYYVNLIQDTVPIHNILVDNCEIGNAKYGIFDHGEHDQFDVHASLYKDWRNYGNVFTRNTIGTSANRIGYAAISFNSEKNLKISHNEISWIDDSLTAVGVGSYAAPNAYGIMQPSGSQVIQPGTIQDSVGNVVNVWIDANRIHNLRAIQGNAYGITFQQAATIYSQAGSTPVVSVLPRPTMNNTTNNMVYDLRVKTGSVYPLTYMTASMRYSTDRDSIFNNSITTNNGTINVKVWNTSHAFIWNNVIQNLGTAGSYTNYSLQLPRPYASALSSDYNLFDLHAPTSPAISTFGTVTEYDAPTGIVLQTRSFRKINDWKTYNQADLHSLTGDPLFASDSLHMPGAFSYVASPASDNGAWLGTSTQLRDFDGDLRLQGNATPDIGADEFEGFKYSNDLAVLSINQPGGYSAKSDTSLVTLDNPMWLNATVKNLSAQAVFNRSVMATVEVAINGGAWQTIYSATNPTENWDVNQAKTEVFQGPTITLAQAKTGVFRVTVFVANDQNNANNTQQKVFRVLLKSNATVVSYNGKTLAGRQNRDSVYFALARLGITGYDTLDRNFYGSTDLDYSPWWTVIYVSGDPNVIPVSGEATGQAYLSFKETQEMERFLQASQTYAKKGLIMAGQNIAFQNGNAMPNNSVTDPEFMNSWMHTKYVSNTPLNFGAYLGKILGGFSDYWQFADSINSASPDMIKPALTTPLVGPEVNWFAYSYAVHNISAADSGAGVTYYNPLYNTVFYGFDWANPFQTDHSEQGGLTSGTTRILKGALDFVVSHGSTILPVDFVNPTAFRVGDGTSAVVKWETARQQDVARFDVERLTADNTWVSRGQVSASSANKYSLTDENVEAAKSYTYRIAAVDKDGSKTYSNNVELAPAAASGITLEQNYPNPTTGVTSVRFALPTDAKVSLRILDVTGKVMTTAFANESVSAGDQSKTLDLSELASGSYIYELTAVTADGQSVVLSKKMTLTK